MLLSCLTSEFEKVALSGPEKKQVKNLMEELLDDYRDQFGIVEGTNAPNTMSIKAAQQTKSATQKQVKSVYDRAIRTQSPVPRANRQTAKTAVAESLRKQIAQADPTGRIGDLNYQMHRDLRWRDLAAKRLRKQGKRSLLSSDITLPFAIEMAARGKPGVATGVGFGKHVLTHPGVLSRSAIAANRLGDLAGGINKVTPPLAVTNTLFELYKQNKAKRKKEEF